MAAVKILLALYRSIVLKNSLMAHFNEKLQVIETKLNRLIDQKKQLETDLQNARNRQKQLEEALASKDSELDELIEKNKILRIAAGKHEGDNKEIKLKINEIVREVDKCIAQLNQ